MYKVVLIDDEKWSLQGLMNVFPWKEVGFEVIAQFTNSQEALNAIVRYNPDVVFTDIRMPNISGIELIKRSFELGKKSEFVIISGYDEFVYAQQALQLGAFDYRLKPVDPDSARDLLDRLKRHIEEKRMNDDIELLDSLANSSNNPYEVFTEKGFDISNPSWLVITIRSKKIIDKNHVSNIVQSINYLSMSAGTDKVIVICNDNFEKLNVLNNSILIDEGYRNDWHIGLSRFSKSIDKISWLLRESDIASCRYFIYDSPGLSIFNTDNINKISDLVKTIESNMLNQNKQNLINQISKIPMFLISNQMGMFHLVEFWNRFILLYRDWIPATLANQELDYLDYSEMINRYKNVHELTEFLKDLVISYYEPNNIKNNMSVNESFLALLADVNQNYTKDISLGDLSSKYFLNFSYCSQLFSKVTGQTFINYITTLRMNKAMELLKKGKYTAQQVSEIVGYNDYYYFSKKFKKTFGISPTQLSERISYSTG